MDDFMVEYLDWNLVSLRVAWFESQMVDLIVSKMASWRYTEQLMVSEMGVEWERQMAMGCNRIRIRCEYRNCYCTNKIKKCKGTSENDDSCQK